MRSLPGFVGPAYRSQSPNADAETCINLYLEAIESDLGKSRAALYPAPGFSAFSTLTQSPCRGQFAQDGRMWAVGGNRVYEVSDVGAVTDRGLVARDSNPATFACSGDAGRQLFITSGDQGYILNLDTHVLTNPVSDVTMGGYVDGYFLGLDAALSRVRVSDLLDGSTWGALQIFDRTAAPDPWISMLIAYREVWLFGSETSEVWYDAGTSPMPFRPVPNVLMPWGIHAAFSAALLDGAPTWLASNVQGACVVVRADGYTPVRISNHAVEYAISTYATTTDARAWSYQAQGHSFYVLTFPSAGVTWVYDATTGQWHQRLFWDAPNAQWTAYRPGFHAYAFGKHLVGDRLTGVIYDMALDYSTDVDGAAMRRQRRSPHVSDAAVRLFCKTFQVDLEAGLGLTTGQGSDPQVMFRFSTDGGKTWSHERHLTAGALGAYLARCKTDRVGSGRDYVFEITMSDAIPWRIVAAYADIDQGRH